MRSRRVRGLTPPVTNCRKVPEGAVHPHGADHRGERSRLLGVREAARTKHAAANIVSRDEPRAEALRETLSQRGLACTRQTEKPHRAEPVRRDLHDFQDGKCFYCDATRGGRVEFFPGARRVWGGVPPSVPPAGSERRYRA